MSEQRPNDASVAGKVAMVAAAATAATNMAKPQRDRESVVGAAFWITVIFFWFRAIYMYFKYVTQWSEVQELGAKGLVWKAVWPLVAAASPLFVIKFMAIGAALHNKSWPMISIYIVLALMLTLFLPFFLDRKYFYADRMPPLTDKVGRFFYSLAFVVSVLLLGSIDSANRYVMWFWSGDLLVSEKKLEFSPRLASPKANSPASVKSEVKYVPDEELWSKTLNEIPRKSSDGYQSDAMGLRQHLNYQLDLIKKLASKEEWEDLAAKQAAWSSFTVHLGGGWKEQVVAYKIRNEEIRNVLIHMKEKELSVN